MLVQALWDVPRETKSPPLFYENCLGHSVETGQGQECKWGQNAMERTCSAGTTDRTARWPALGDEWQVNSNLWGSGLSYWVNGVPSRVGKRWAGIELQVSMESKSILSPFTCKVWGACKASKWKCQVGRGAGGSGALEREQSWIYTHTTYVYRHIWDHQHKKLRQDSHDVRCEYDMPRCSLGGIYPAWCSLGLLDLWFHVWHELGGNLSLYRFTYFSPSCLFGGICILWTLWIFL